MVALTVTLALLREAWRAICFPVWVIAYLPRRRYWQARTRAALMAPPGTVSTAHVLHALRRNRSTGTPAHVFVSAGEISGEQHAAALIDAVHDLGLRPRWTCFGGPRLAAAGGDVRFALSAHAIMGVAGVLRSLPFILRAFASFVRLLRDDPPDVVVLVDYPGLHLVMGRQARRRGIPVVHYVAPQYWAWAPWRLRRYRACIDATWAILPFEPAYYAQAGIAAQYIGNPLLDQIDAAPADPVAVREVRARPTLCLLPGSRRSEIERNLPHLVRITRNLRRRHPGLRCVIAHVDERRRDLIAAGLAEAGSEGELELHIGPLAAWLAGARVVLAKSGTGSLEACLHGAPTVVFYRMRGPLVGFLFRNYLNVPWIAAANLIAGRVVVPEFCFAGDDGWANVEAAASDLLAEGPTRATMLTDLAEVRRRLGASGATRRAARSLVEFLTGGAS